MNILPLIEIIEDLSRKMSKADRYQRLIIAIQQAIPCDAIALLKLEGEYLCPVAMIGLKEETLERRFPVANHPRLQAILQTPQFTRFDAYCELPDPYDGLVDSESNKLHVHDCMGCSIIIDGAPWGVLTLDSIKPGRFDSYNLADGRAYIAAVSAVIKTSQYIRALEIEAIHKHQVALHLTDNEQAQTFIGRSSAVKSMLKEVNTVAPSNLSVLITGETGVGKELVAKSIYRNSLRHKQPLVQINCAALPESIIESELFGHKKGAFSGAIENRSGRFELADGGTLFLDEIGELSLPVQSKLLRALQSGEIQRVGSDKTITVDVRVIAATNRNLQQEVKNGRFRADLYHRLSVYPLSVPPLRERAGDLILLAGYFLEKNQSQLGVAKLRLQADAQKQLEQYDWPGNVRELEHLLSRASLKAVTEQGRNTRIISVDLHHIDLQNAPPRAAKESTESSEPIIHETGLRESTEQHQKQLIRFALEKCCGNLAATARALRLDRSNLIRTMKRLGIS